jgi:hypothetical protein
MGTSAEILWRMKQAEKLNIILLMQACPDLLCYLPGHARHHHCKLEPKQLVTMLCLQQQRNATIVAFW